MQIRTASQQKSVTKHGGYRRFTENALRLRWETARPISWGASRGTVQAEVIRSNWAVRCPHCAGAMFVEPGEPFFCPDCGMQANDWLPMTVVWPEERATIERVLLARSDPLTRNWTRESVAALRAENLAHGEAEE